jgi:hypothetical protein
MADFQARLNGSLPEADQYIAAHNQARKLDDTGDWDAARLLVLPENNTDTSNPRFALLDSKLNERLSSISASTSALSSRSLSIAQILVGLAAIGAAGLVRVGYLQRIREYQ